MSQKFIVKVQWPLTSSEPDHPPAMIYTKPGEQSFCKFIPTSEGLRKAMGGRQKAYFWATLSDEACEGDHFVTLGELAPDQDW